MNKEYKPRSNDSSRPTRRPKADGTPSEQRKRAFKKDDRPAKKSFADKPSKKEWTKGDRQEKGEHKSFERRPAVRTAGGERPAVRKPSVRKTDKDTVRLNKYIANAGICSRREADKLIEAGSVKVNGQVVTQMGYQVKPGDVVSYGGETLSTEAKRYFLMNKPKGYITTVDDPQERKTVMMLIDGACRERIYPVGRLDRNTTGLLLFTNDGELARKLTHPSTMVYKVYQVELNKAVTRDDMKKMLEGIELEDGMIKVDDVQYAEGFNDKRVVGVALHSGRNRIVRRIFEHLGYEVHKLDRVIFAGLTKKDLPRGRYRELTDKEVGFLKMV